MVNSIFGQVDALRRPGVLIRAAWFFVANQNAGNRPSAKQNAHSLAKIKGQMLHLIDDEQRHETLRKASAADYNIKSHIEILAALISAVQSLQKKGPLPV